MTPPVVREDDRVLLVLPLFHVYGLNAGFGLVAAAGACAVLEETFDPRASLTLMAEEGVTAVPGAPPMYQAWLAAADAAGNDAELRRGFAAMRMASSGRRPAARGGLDGDARPRRGDRVGGVRADRGRARRGQHPGHRPRQARLHRRPAARGRGRAPGHRDQRPRRRSDHADDPARRPRAWRRGPGEIWVRGPNLFAGYWPDGADGPDADGWLGTGDLAYRDADGDLHLVDRRSDLILVSGFNVYPAEVERVLDTHPAVAESAVIGVPDPAPAPRCARSSSWRRGRRLTFEELRDVRRRVPGPLQGADVGELPARRCRTR